MKKKLLSLLLAISFVIILLPSVVISAEAEVIASGKSTDGFTWTFDSEGTLTITGKGAMANYLPAGGGNTSWVHANLGYNYQDLVKRIILSSGITSVGNAAFDYCRNLVAVDLPDTVKSIGNYAFLCCFNLKTITIPDSVTDIGFNAFQSCDSLTRIIIPKSVTSIDNEAFARCTSLSNITFMGDAPTFGGQYVFEDVSAVVRYPANNATWTASVMKSYGGTLTWDALEQLSITTQPKNAYVKSGKTAKVTVKAEGDGLKYQWYIKNAGGKKYSKSSVTSSTYSCTMNEKAKDRYVYCVVTDQYGNSVKSKTVVLREAVSIVTEPKTAYAKSGKAVKVSVEASGDELTYQWYIKNAGASKYSKSSVTSATYSAKMSDKVHGRRVYCVVTDKYGKTVQSKTVLLRMAATITTQPKNVTVAEGKTAKVTVKAVGDELTYTWYIKNEGSSKFSKSSVTKSTYSVKMSDKADGRQVYCVVTDKYGKTVKSNTVTLSMK